MFKKFSKKKLFGMLFAVMSVVMCLGVFAFAEDVPYVGKSLVDSTAMNIVSHFGEDLKVTIPVILGILIPIRLAIWIFPATVNKGLSMFTRAFSKGIKG